MSLLDIDELNEEEELFLRMEHTVDTEEVEDFEETIEQVKSEINLLYKWFLTAYEKELETTMYKTNTDKQGVIFLKAYLLMLKSLIELPKEEARKKIIELKETAIKIQTEKINELTTDTIKPPRYQKPENYIQSLTKATERFFDGKTDLSNGFDLIVGTRKATKKKPVEEFCVRVKCNVLDEETTPQNIADFLTLYDREVFNAICSIFVTDQDVMTLSQIYEVMTGTAPKSTKATEKIEHSILKMRSRVCNIDWRRHIEMLGLDINPTGAVVHGANILMMESVEMNTNGVRSVAYKLVREPILLKYAKDVKQVSTTNMKYLQVPNLIHTEENIIIKGHLIRQIEHIKTNKNWNSTLTFETIFENCNISINKTIRKRKRDEIFKMLNYWKETSYIKDYEIIRKGRSYYGIKIVID